MLHMAQKRLNDNSNQKVKVKIQFCLSQTHKNLLNKMTDSLGITSFDKLNLSDC